MKKLILAIVATLGLFAGTATMASATHTWPVWTIVEGQSCPSWTATPKVWKKVYLGTIMWGGGQAFYWVCAKAP